MLGLILAVLSSSFASADGLSHGDKFVATHLSGSVNLFCHEGNNYGSAYFNCAQDILDPVEYDYFVTDDSVAADSVLLKSVNNQNEVKKTVRYNSKKKSSRQRINLWIQTLTQRPLLDFGTNTVSYVMKKSDKIIKSGSFSVNVDEGPSRHCRSASMDSTNIEDCRTNSAYICDRYFSYQNYCQ